MKNLLIASIILIASSAFAGGSFPNKVPASVKEYALSTLKTKCPSLFEDGNSFSVISYSKNRLSFDEEVIYELLFNVSYDYGHTNYKLDLRFINEDIFHSPSQYTLLSLNSDKNPLCQ